MMDPIPLRELPEKKDRINNLRNKSHTGPSKDGEKYKGNNQIYESIKDSQSYSSVIKRFAIGYSTAHGFPNIYKSSGIWGQTLWFLIFVGGIVAVTMQMYLLIGRYFDFTTSTEVQIITKTKLEFPAVTVCNTNKIRRTAISESRHKQALYLDGLTPLSYYAPCLENDFHCYNGALCIKKYLRCDGVNNCKDFSDEVDCFYGECAPSQFRCNNGSDSSYCIDRAYVCNNRDDCYDGEDEWECECKPSEFKCRIKGACIRRSKVCDKEVNCVDESDEEYCPDADCTDGFSCLINGYEKCLSSVLLCDDVRDCDNGYDETTDRCSGGGVISLCAKEEFDCGGNKCIPAAWVCDRAADCLDGKDENLEQCGEERVRCYDDQFACANGYQCIQLYWACDFYQDCIDGSDESNCVCTAELRSNGQQLQTMQCSGNMVNWEDTNSGNSYSSSYYDSLNPEGSDNDFPETLYHLGIGESVTITSPNYPDQYPNDAGLAWIFVADSGVFIISVTQFSTEEGYDFFHIGSGLKYFPGTSKDIFSGTGLSDFVFLGPQMWLVFQSDHSRVDNGFEIKVSQSDEDDVPKVTTVDYYNVTMHNLDLGESVTITSANYPDQYPNDVFEAWTFWADSGVYLVTFNNFSTESDYDYLAIGPAMNPVLGPSTQLYSGDAPSDRVVLSSEMWLTFTSDFSNTEYGFEIEVTLLDENDIPNVTTVDVNRVTMYNLSLGESVIITTPNFPEQYPVDYYAAWTFAADSGLYLISFTQFSTEKDYDVLLIGPGVNPLPGPSTQRLSGNSTFSDLIILSSEMWLVFQSDETVQDTGFQLQVTLLDEYDSPDAKVVEFRMAYNLNEDQIVSIKSPNYPDQYPNDALEIWTFDADSGVYLLTIKHFSTEEDYDYLFMGPGLTPQVDQQQQFSGTGLSDRVVFSSQMWLLFQSDGTVTDSGFEIEVTRIDESNIPIIEETVDFEGGVLLRCRSEFHEHESIIPNYNYRCNGQLSCFDAATGFPEPCITVYHECFVRADGVDYRGTKSDQLCTGWQITGPSLNLTKEMYPEPDLGNHDFCRNPGHTRDTAYCLPQGANSIDNGMDCLLTPDDTCHQGQTLFIRLAGGVLPTEGRVEVKHKTVWGSIIDDNWSLMEAEVVCRHLGFLGALDAFNNAQFGVGNGPLYMTSVDCAGNEITLLDCYYQSMKEGNVEGRQDVGVACHNDQPGRRKRSAVNDEDHRETGATDSVQTALECYTKPLGEDYRGIVSLTETGLPCQNWAVQISHQHATTSNSFPGAGLGDHNCCRNPNSQTGGTWCYTTDPDTFWEYCNVGPPSIVCVRHGDEIAGGVFICLSGETIPDWQTCNQFPDCQDGSDEYMCGPKNSLCPNGGEVPCRDELKCIKSYMVCDGFSDCLTGSDENVCYVNECPLGYWKCTSTRRCIPEFSKCNTFVDCSEGEDELDCMEVVSDTKHPFNSSSWNEPFADVTLNKPELLNVFEKEVYKPRRFHRVRGEDPPDWQRFAAFSDTPDYSDLNQVLKVTREEIRTLGHQAADFILECTYDYNKCNPKSDFKMFESDRYGSCYTYNFNPDLDRMTEYSTATGQNSGLRMTLYLEQNDYISLHGQEAGVIVTINPPDVRPSPDDEGITIRPGVVASIGLRFEAISRLGGRYGKCVPVDETTSIIMNGTITDSSGGPYTKHMCERVCLYRAIIDRCSCSDTIELDGPRCHITNTTQDLCVQFVRFLHQIHALDCGCSQQCTDRFYTKTISQSVWPSDVYMKHLLRNIHSINDKTKDIHDIHQVRNNLLRLEIYFEELNYAQTKEVPGYEISSLFSDIGGTFGLYIGFSVITILEFVVLVYNIFHTCVYRN